MHPTLVRFQNEMDPSHRTRTARQKKTNIQIGIQVHLLMVHKTTMNLIVTIVTSTTHTTVEYVLQIRGTNVSQFH